MKIFFTSDQHFGHANIIKYCPIRKFSSVEEMNEGLVKNFNTRVSEGDVTYHIGDFSLSLHPMQVYLPRLKGTHHLISGNHDKCHPSDKKASKQQEFEKEYLKAGFASVQTELSLTLDGIDFLLCHFPYTGDHTAVDRFQKYRPKDEGKILLHGHVHSLYQVRDRCINVGVDVWDLTPVESPAIIQIAKEILARQLEKP